MGTDSDFESIQSEDIKHVVDFRTPIVFSFNEAHISVWVCVHINFESLLVCDPQSISAWCPVTTYKVVKCLECICVLYSSLKHLGIIQYSIESGGKSCFKKKAPNCQSITIVYPATRSSVLLLYWQYPLRRKGSWKEVTLFLQKQCSSSALSPRCSPRSLLISRWPCPEPK